MRFHAIQNDVITNDTNATQVQIENLIQNAHIGSGDFVVLPEMTTTGFSMNIEIVSQGDAVSWGCFIAKQFGIWLQIGWANRDGSRAKNCVSVCSPCGESIATYEKNFTCNPLGEHQIIDQGHELVIVEIKGRNICPLICYDLRFPELWRLATLSGAEIFTNSANWPLKRIHSWTSLLIARAIENQAQVIGANRVGEDEVSKWGGSSIAISEEGITLAEADTCSEICVSATFEKENSQSWRNEFQALQDTNRSLLGNIEVRHITA
jgi:predicted amidohydrolase